MLYVLALVIGWILGTITVVTAASLGAYGVSMMELKHLAENYDTEKNETQK